MIYAHAMDGPILLGEAVPHCTLRHGLRRKI